MTKTPTEAPPACFICAPQRLLAVICYSNDTLHVPPLDKIPARAGGHPRKATDHTRIPPARGRVLPCSQPAASFAFPVLMGAGRGT